MELTVNERISNNIEIMKKVKLSQLCSMQSGGTPSRGKSEYYNGTIPWSKISDLEKSNDGNIYKTEEHITTEGLKSINNRLFKKGTLLLAMYGSVGKTAIAEIDLSTNQAILGINIKDESKLDIKYLRFWFTTIKEKLLNRAVGGTLQNISMGIVKDLEIPLPPLPTQQKIAEILDTADQLRQYNKQLIEKYDALTQSLFLEMFGDPVRNKKEWEMKKLSEVCEKITDGTHQSPKFIKSGIPFLLVSNIIKNKIDFATKKFISEEDFNILNSRTPIEIGNILYTSVGSYGNPAIIETETKFAFQRHIAFLKPKHSKINFRFLFEILKTDSFKREVNKKVKGAAQKTLNLIELKNFEIPVPSLSLQNQFAERVQMIETQKQQAQETLTKSEDLFQSLLQRAFKGELN